MLKRGTLFFSLLLVGLFAESWDYQKHGPNTWGKLGGKWKICATGRSQSPIDISPKDAIKVENTLKKSYLNDSKYIVNNGHSIEVDYEDGGKISLHNQEFRLKQFHFHTPSETHINHKKYPMEIHFVHESKDEKLLVLAVLVEEGGANRAFEQILNHVPIHKNEKLSLIDFDPQALMPQESGYYKFSGSLTTPPCSEGVTWIVLKKRITASQDQIQKIHAIMHDNARPIQPLNHRKIEETN